MQNSQSKTTLQKLAEQVKNELHAQGFSFLYNEQDFKHHERRTRRAFNRPYTIANTIILEAGEPSDYHSYTF